VPVNTLSVTCAGLVAYLLAGIPVGWLVVRRRLYGLDLRRYGSGNVGASNVYRHAGLTTAALVGPVQFFQGFVPVGVAQLVGFPVAARALIAACAVLGNGWPVWLRFNGGRGVAVATGAIAALSPVALLALLTCFAAGALAGAVAEGVLLGFLLAPAAAGLVDGAVVALGCVALLALIALRRLEGLLADVRRAGGGRLSVGGPSGMVALGGWRLLHDRRPGRPLVGPRTDEQPIGG